MNLLQRIKTALAAVALSAAFTVSAPAQVQVKPEEASKHFAAVAKHLELGGLYFSYMDVDGDLESLAKLGNQFLDAARKSDSSIPKNYNFTPILEASGLNSIKAVGMSSRSIGQGLYHNRALLYMPDGPQGFMKLFGGKPAPLAISSWAPADAGAAVQIELTLGTLVDTVTAMLKGVGEQHALDQWQGLIAMPLPPLGGMTAGEMFKKLNTRVMMVMRMDESKKIVVPGAPFEMPGLQIMIAVDDVDFLMTPILQAMENNDEAVVEKEENTTVIRMNSSLPGALSWFKPGILHDKKSKRIIFTSHLEMAKNAGTGDTLGSNEAFKKAIAGLPAEANGLSYVTPQFVKGILTWYRQVLDETMKSSGITGVQEAILKGLLDIAFSLPEAPLASAYANLPEGMLFASNTNTTHKWTMMQATLLPVFVAAAAGGAYQATMARGREAQRAAEQAPKAKKIEDAPDASDKAIKNNLQQIGFAAQTWFIDHPGDKEVTYETLVKNELVFELAPVARESYKGLTVKRKGGELSVKLKNGDSISHKYPAVTD